MISLVSRTFAAATTLAPVNTQALSYNGNVSGQRDAALDQINAKNAAQFIENRKPKCQNFFRRRSMRKQFKMWRLMCKG